MVNAVVLVNVERGKVNEVAETLAGMRAISEVYSVTVNYMVAMIAQNFMGLHFESFAPAGLTEYDAVREEMERLGFHRGWVQEWGSAITYQPDFTRPHPFE
mgnify:CR=1 FL=1